MSEIDLSLLGDFIEEAVEHLDEMESNLLQLKPGADNKDFCNEIFRPIHSIKGAAQFVGLDRIALLTHRMEDLLDKLRQGLMEVTPATIDILMAGRDRVQQLVTELQESEQEHSVVDDLVDQLNAHIAGEEAPDQTPAETTETNAEITHSEIEVSDELDDLSIDEPEVIDWHEADTVLETHELSSLLVDEDHLIADEESEESAIDPTGIQAEIRNAAAQDAELFGIFRQHLQDRLDVLNMLGGALKVSDEPTEIYDELRQQIERLRSAANYMGFNQLIAFYDDWNHWLENAITGEIRDDPAASYTHTRLAVLNSLSPQLDATNDGANQADEPVIVAPVDSILSEDLKPSDFFSEDFEDDGAHAEFHVPQVSDMAESVDEQDDFNRFIADARLHLDAMEESLGALRSSPSDMEAVESLFRVSHTLKGSAQFAGIPAVAELSGKMEDMLYPIQDVGLKSTDQLLLLNLGYATLLQLIEEMEQGKGEETSIIALVERFDSYAGGNEQNNDGSQDVVDARSVNVASEPSEFPESYSPHEETDKELFEIFINQLNELFDEIRKAANDFSTSGDGALFQSSTHDILSRLGSAASYMGYENLYQLYREWKGQLVALAASPEGKKDAEDVVEDYIIRANALVSGSTLTGMSNISTMSDLPNEVSEAAPKSDVPFDAEPEQIAAIAPPEIKTLQQDFDSTPAKNQTITPRAEELPSTLKESIKPEPKAETEIPTADKEESANLTSREPLPQAEDERFIRLTQALEEGFSTTEQHEYETLHGVFEEMLSSVDVDAIPPVNTAPVSLQSEPEKTAKNPPISKPNVKPEPKSTPRLAATSAMKSQVKSASPNKPANSGAESLKKTKPKPPPERKPVSGVAQSDQSKTADTKSAGSSIEKKSDSGPVASSINKPSSKSIKKSIRVESDRIDILMNQVGELVVDRSYFTQLLNEVNALQRHLKEELGVDKEELKNISVFGNRLGEAINALMRTSNELQEGVMKVRMLPISQLFSRYPRLIHDLTNNTRKKVNLELKGEDTELDKMIVEELSDPLIHIIRNAVDHGLEPVDERLRMGKPEQGVLQVEAYQEGNQIVIEVTDDGRGIDPEKLKAKALQKGLHNRDELERMSSQDLTKLIMKPGFSTADKISRTSGRGVGMDVVKKNIERLNGTIDISSQKNSGTSIRLRIPLTLAIIQALQIKVADRLFTIPLSNVVETLNIEGMGTSLIEGTEVLHLRGRTLPIFRLNKMFKLENSSDNQIPFVVVVTAGNKQVGLVVDELIGQDEVVIKPLAEYVQENSGFSGATIIGDGRISLILDVAGLIAIVAQEQMARHQGLVQKRRIEAKG